MAWVVIAVGLVGCRPLIVRPYGANPGGAREVTYAGDARDGVLEDISAECAREYAIDDEWSDSMHHLRYHCTNVEK